MAVRRMTAVLVLLTAFAGRAEVKLVQADGVAALAIPLQPGSSGGVWSVRQPARPTPSSYRSQLRTRPRTRPIPRSVCFSLLCGDVWCPCNGVFTWCWRGVRSLFGIFRETGPWTRKSYFLQEEDEPCFAISCA